MKIVDEIKSFFSVDSILKEERKRSKKNYDGMNQQLDKLKRISEILKDHSAENESDGIDEEIQPWVYLKKNCFIESVVDILSGKELKH